MEGPAIPKVRIPEGPDGCLFRPSKLAIGPYYIDTEARMDKVLSDERGRKWNVVDSIFRKTGKPFKEWERVLEPMRDELFKAYDFTAIVTAFLQRTIDENVPADWQHAIQSLEYLLPLEWQNRMKDLFTTAVNRTVSGRLINYTKNVLLTNIVYDGCYFLEMMLEPHERVTSDVPLFDPTKMEDYRHDMLLVDNQIPLKVLVSLASIRRPDQQHDPFKFVIDRILRFFSLPRVSISESDKCLHLLDVCRFALLGSTKDTDGSKRTNSHAQCFHILDVFQHGLHDDEVSADSNQTTFKALHFYIPSATELREAQITITTSKTSNLMDISFIDEKTLRLPPVHVANSIKWIYHNVILLEHFHPRANKSLSSYICFMNRLLKSDADCSLLQSCDVMITSLPECEVVKLFQGLREFIEHYPNMMMDTALQKVGKNLKDRYNKNLEPWRKDLFQTYLKSPFAIISTIVAFFIFSFTAIQAIYAVLSFYKGK